MYGDPDIKVVGKGRNCPTCAQPLKEMTSIIASFNIWGCEQCDHVYHREGNNLVDLNDTLTEYRKGNVKFASTGWMMG